VSLNDLDTTLRNMRSQALRCYVFVTYLRDRKEFGGRGREEGTPSRKPSMSQAGRSLAHDLHFIYFIHKSLILVRFA
jgi:hypothetical protein